MGAHDSPEDLATGRRHDQSIWVLSLPLGIAVGLVLGWAAALIAAASCLAGGLWLSPDLDTRSNALRRWGALGFLEKAEGSPAPQRIGAGIEVWGQP